MVLKFVVAIAMLLVAKLSPRCAFGVHTQRGAMSEGRFFGGVLFCNVICRIALQTDSICTDCLTQTGQRVAQTQPRGVFVRRAASDSL